MRAVRRVLEAGELAAKVRSRQTIILESIERHATLAPELRERILATFDPDALEDLYHPYRQQKKNRALAAREAGLQPLADWIWSCGHGSERPQEGQTLELWAFTFRNEDKGVPDAKSAIEGARDILVERLAGDARAACARARASTSRRDASSPPRPEGETALAFRELLRVSRAGRRAARAAARAQYLALRRGQAEDELSALARRWGGRRRVRRPADRHVRGRRLHAPDSPGAEVLRHARRIALKNDVRTAIENEVHRVLKEAADAAVVAGFAESARRHLLAAPFGGRAVIGVDPGLRGGCRLAALDAAGALVASRVLELATDEQKAVAGQLVAGFARDHGAARSRSATAPAGAS